MENNLETNPFRDAVWEASYRWIEEKRSSAEKAMQAAQEAANGESKSSAGDKYETGRAMAQNDRDLYASQWAQWNDLQQQLHRFKQMPIEPAAVPGSLMETSLGWFWVSISIGRILVHDQMVTILSPHSPLGKTLLGKKIGDPFLFQGKEGRVLGLF
ncbi:MAG: 3-oxoacyl-ACP synthase [Spirosomataceae bacterium]